MRSVLSIVAREDTLLGACYGVGEDFGFNPNYLRILFASVLFWSPAASFAAYAALWTLVAFTRVVVPNPASAAAAPAAAVGEAGATAEEAREPLPLAA
jgi:phage shock protein PspC (stress-responsive transcriptional regulator)